MTTFKQMIKSDVIKRADAMKIDIEDIHEEPGFNLREEGEDLEASIDALAAHIVSGGIVPPLEVRPRAEGGVWLVDGHRRARAFRRVADTLRDANGKLWIAVVAFTGNDADRVARVITSAEGRSLSLLEIAKGYARLIAYGWDAAQIAAKVGKTPQHVGQLLTLATANTDVQRAVTAGTVSATTAIGMVRQHGEEAGKVIAEAAGKAAAAGKKKVTTATLKGKPLPRKLTDEVFESLAQFVGTLTHDDHAVLNTINLSNAPKIEVSAGAVWELLAIHNAAVEFRAAEEKKIREAANENAQTEIAA